MVALAGPIRIIMTVAMNMTKFTGLVDLQKNEKKPTKY